VFCHRGVFFKDCRFVREKDIGSFPKVCLLPTGSYMNKRNYTIYIFEKDDFGNCKYECISIISILILNCYLRNIDTGRFFRLKPSNIVYSNKCVMTMTRTLLYLQILFSHLWNTEDSIKFSNCSLLLRKKFKKHIFLDWKKIDKFVLHYKKQKFSKMRSIKFIIYIF
jgi:hypothetical protein